ncbi:HlyD family efflux transporter periplasmic adaptor subunit [uncultured Shimia sp.]|uniref:HlyD family efflux transporter periplasmic adaptor subunit n=1 Tax=uncultured Shimia sp. TaxID=573152 RepID=UPI0026092B5A|nr:HlyD family efflux transporter periplasmic adaptor subunit [uncultured Shimia sp.]
MSPRPEGGLPSQVTQPLRVGLYTIVCALAILGLWACLVPLATSVSASGHLHTRKPSLDIQHRFGGKIAKVHVAPHDAVNKGQILMQLDTSDAEAELGEMQATLAPMQEERAALRAALDGDLTAQQADLLAPQTQLALQRMQVRREVLTLRTDMTHQLEVSLRQRAERHHASLQHLTNRQHSMQARLDRYTTLANRGALRAAETEALKESILNIQADLAREQAKIASLDSQATQAKLQVARDKLEFRQNILDRQAQLEEAIPRLRLQMLRLSAQIDQADIRAPDDGIVASLPYDTAAMVIAQGDTVVTLARTSDTLDVAFLANPQTIDQLRVGMQGYMTVTGLPQRNHPKVRVTLTSLSPEARRDQNNMIVGYDGVAVMNAQDRDHLREEMGEYLNLTRDMPVHLVFTGRETTFADYLIGPFLRFLNLALQD